MDIFCCTTPDLCSMINDGRYFLVDELYREPRGLFIFDGKQDNEEENSQGGKNVLARS